MLGLVFLTVKVTEDEISKFLELNLLFETIKNLL